MKFFATRKLIKFLFSHGKFCVGQKGPHNVADLLWNFILCISY